MPHQPHQVFWIVLDSFKEREEEERKTLWEIVGIFAQQD